MTTTTLNIAGAEITVPTIELFRAWLDTSLANALPADPYAPPALNPGEKYVGLIVSADGAKRHHIILLPGEAESVTYAQAMEWATSAGGELPDRTESALLFATLKDEFAPGWHWTREQHASVSDYAWMQDFTGGDQDSYHETFTSRARAIRRLPL